MDSSNTFKDYKPPFLLRKVLPWALYAILPIALFRLLINPLIISSSSPSWFLPSKGKGPDNFDIGCDYSNGEWVHDKSGPLYTKCDTVKEGQNCITHGRPDKGYLYWRWKPKQCELSRFDPKTFLQILKNKNLAFIGDSLARNQLESLLCMLATFSAPKLVFTHGEDNKFRKWHFQSHNVNISIYWSPFLVKGVEKTNERNFNTLHLDSVDEKWGSEIIHMDMIVLSIGHWYLHPAVYFYGDEVLGCHYCSGQNYTEIGFFDVYGKAFKTTLRTIIERKGKDKNNGVDVIVTTFSPAHFEGEWDKLGACSKTKPYGPDEKKLEGMDEEMRKSEIEEVKIARLEAENLSSTVRLEAVDVTKLALLRPDGHPGPYMHPFPFANGIEERVQNDCVHWCLPGPIDTWNEILLQVMKKWHG